MKFVAFNDQRIGVIRGDEVVDVTTLLDTGPAPWPPVRMVRFIRDYERLADQVRARVDSESGRPVADVSLRAPIEWPNKLIAFPANYQRHIDEMNSRNRADVNAYFLKAASSISGPSDPIILPALDGGLAVHHECELAVIIGRPGRHIPPERAMQHVFGFTCLIDVTVRSPQERVARKSFDSFAPIGPWIVTRDEVRDPSALALRLWVNGELRQDANTRDLLLGINDMIAMSSAISTLHPGDIIATGTPDGVGPLESGDVVTIWIEDVGEMSVPVVQAPRQDGFQLTWGRPVTEAGSRNA